MFRVVYVISSMLQSRLILVSEGGPCRIMILYWTISYIDVPEHHREQPHWTCENINPRPSKCWCIYAGNYPCTINGEALTHLPRVPHIWVSELAHHCHRQWLAACSAPSHYLKQCWRFVNWALENKSQWNFNRNFSIFIHKNALKMSSAKWGPFCTVGYELTLGNLIILAVIKDVIWEIEIVPNRCPTPLAIWIHIRH